MKNLFTLAGSLSPRHASIIKFVALLALAFLAEFFLREDILLGGVNFSSFLFLSAIFVAFLPLDKAFYSVPRVLLVAYTALCIAFSLYTDDFSPYALVGIIMMCIAHKHGSPSLATLWILPLILFCISFLFEYFIAIIARIDNRTKATEQKDSINMSKIFPYFILPAFLSFVFLGIFSEGYEEFALLVDNISSFIWDLIENLFNIDFLIFFLIFLFLLALYETRISSKALVKKDISFDLNEIWEKSFIICLVCFNVIFLSLNLINLKDFLFQANEYNLARDAISACDSMVLGSFFAGFFTLIFFLAKNQNKTLRSLLLAWLVQNLLIILTALVKLSTYIAGYSLTLDRLDGLSLICFLAICIILALAKMYSSMTTKALNYYIVYLFFGFAFVYTCLDKEDFIARYNLNHSENPDFEYLKELSPHSLVAIYEYQQEGNSIDIDLNREIDLGLNFLELNTWKNKILRAKLIEIQKKLEASSN